LNTSRSAPPVTQGTREWIEKYSQQHKRKFWKNQITGKATWDDPYKNEIESGAGGSLVDGKRDEVDSLI
jgi:heat shock protein HslJ